MNKQFKKMVKDKRFLFFALVIILFVVFVAASSPKLRIIDKTNTLMRSSGQQYSTRPLSKINKIIVHHSAAIGQTAEDYARYHVQSKGWPAIGYHFVIEINGDIIQANPINKISYHVANHNSPSIGICLSGDFTKQEPTSQQLKSLKKLIQYLRKQLPQPLEVYGHRDYGQTSCPGHNLAKHLYKFKLA